MQCTIEQQPTFLDFIRGGLVVCKKLDEHFKARIVRPSGKG